MLKAMLRYISRQFSWIWPESNHQPKKSYQVWFWGSIYNQLFMGIGEVLEAFPRNNHVFQGAWAKTWLAFSHDACGASRALSIISIGLQYPLDSSVRQLISKRSSFWHTVCVIRNWRSQGFYRPGHYFGPRLHVSYYYLMSLMKTTYRTSRILWHTLGNGKWGADSQPVN